MACSVTKQAARIRAKSIKTANGFAYENAASVAQKSMAMMVAAKYNHGQQTNVFRVRPKARC